MSEFPRTLQGRKSPTHKGRPLLRLAVVFPCALLLGAREPDDSPRRSASGVALKTCQLPNVDGEARCGTYEVYENRAARAGRKISLNIVVLPALEASHAPDPVFWLHGGPGAAATQTVPAAKNGFLEVFRKNRDLVFVDQRGTGKSNGLICELGDDPKKLQIYFGKLFPPEAVRACREKLEGSADLRLYTTPIAMDDLDEVRQALGYKKINIVAASYGTIAAQVYLRQHPSSVRAVFLVGVATPEVKQPLLFAAAAQHALDLLFVDCAADELCRREFPNIKSEFHAVLSRFDHGPLEVSLREPVTKEMQKVSLERENFVERIRLLLYTTTFASFVPLVIHRAYQGDFVPFEAISIAYNPGSLLSRGMYFTVSCSEGVPFITEPEIVRESRGNFVGESRVRVHIEACKLWPRGNVSRHFIDPVKSDVPVMMFSGELDGSTPPWFGKRAVQYLSNGRQVTVRYYGHQLDSHCLWAVMRDFIQSRSARAVDTSCIGDVRRPPFATDIPKSFSL